MALTNQEKEVFYKIVGERIKEARKAASINQDELARMIGMSRVSVVNIEKGRQSPPIHLLLEISNALRIEPGLLFPKFSEIKNSEVKVILGKELPEFVNIHKLIKFTSGLGK